MFVSVWICVNHFCCFGETLFSANRRWLHYRRRSCHSMLQFFVIHNKNIQWQSNYSVILNKEPVFRCRCLNIANAMLLQFGYISDSLLHSILLGCIFILQPTINNMLHLVWWTSWVRLRFNAQYRVSIPSCSIHTSLLLLTIHLSQCNWENEKSVGSHPKLTKKSWIA